MNTQVKCLPPGIKKLINDTNALEELYEFIYPRFKSYILKKGGRVEDAQDIMQEAILQLLMVLKGKPSCIHSNVRNYLFGICKNLWRTHLQITEKLQYIPEVFDSVGFGKNDILDQLINKDEKAVFKKYYNQLGENTQNLWELYFDGKSAREIASIMGFSEGYVRKKKCESKKRLFKMIANDPVYLEWVA
ncbi:sigma-70 family RNA polymerase sigma factor [Aquimarina sp. 2201CG1-2-11]|uniref:RNA polymerase sigma factor n=1 Tax=Aquimarina discodermiae TaxID=3231043 RepID=UPI003462578C